MGWLAAGSAASGPAAAAAVGCCFFPAADVGLAAARMLLLQRAAAPFAWGILLLCALPACGSAVDLEALFALVWVTVLPNARAAGCFCWLPGPADVGGVGNLEPDSRVTTGFFLMGVPDVLPMDSLDLVLVDVFSLPLIGAIDVLELLGLTLTTVPSLLLLLATGLSARCHFRLSSCLGSIKSDKTSEALLKQAQAALVHRGLGCVP